MYFMVVSSLNLSTCLNLFQISQRTMSGGMSERLGDACWPVKHGWSPDLVTLAPPSLCTLHSLNAWLHHSPTPLFVCSSLLVTLQCTGAANFLHIFDLLEPDFCDLQINNVPRFPTSSHAV